MDEEGLHPIASSFSIKSLGGVPKADLDILEVNTNDDDLHVYIILFRVMSHFDNICRPHRVCLLSVTLMNLDDW